MKIVKRTAAAVTGAVLALGVGVALAPAANAEAGDCWSGYACLWQGPSFSSAKYGVSLSRGTLRGLSHNNNAESVSANGRSCAVTDFYAEETAGQNYGFMLASKQLQWVTGFPWKDASLANGIDEASPLAPGSIYSRNWANTVSSWSFSSCGF